jgi:hypothetical protein
MKLLKDPWEMAIGTTKCSIILFYRNMTKLNNKESFIQGQKIPIVDGIRHAFWPKADRKIKPNGNTRLERGKKVLRNILSYF